jgi:hypothetical protein
MSSLKEIKEQMYYLLNCLQFLIVKTMQKPSETNYMNDLALSQEEYDAQLARALAE